MTQDFDLLLEKVRHRHCISLVGAGGKTTLMFALADRLAAEGRRVLITTTTHIQFPRERPVAYTQEEAAALLARSLGVVYGVPASAGKLTIPADWNLDTLRQLCDHIFIEADGAKQHPCKVPRSGEPVLDPHTDLVIGVMGLSALNQPMETACFRLPEAMALLSVPAQHRLSIRDIANILTSPQGTKKGVDEREYVIVLNQCDIPVARNAAGALRQLLQPETVFFTSLLPYMDQERKTHARTY